jgi:hypothetical protein
MFRCNRRQPAESEIAGNQPRAFSGKGGGVVGHRDRRFHNRHDELKLVVCNLDSRGTGAEAET